MKDIILFLSTLLAVFFPAIVGATVFDSTVTVFRAGSWIEYCAIGDVNADGLKDVVTVSESGADSTSYSILVWLQGANGQLQQSVKVKHGWPGRVGCMMLAHLDKPSGSNKGNSTSVNQQVLIGLFNRLYIYSWLNNTLVITDSFETHQQPYSNLDAVATGDFDADGLTDIAVSHANEKRITVIYRQNDSINRWDMRHYNMPTVGFGHLVAGMFGSLKSTALIYMGGQHQAPLIIVTFDKARNVLKEHVLRVDPILSNSAKNSMAIMRKANGRPAELWLTFGGNTPDGKIAIWRDTQQLPDSIFEAYERPEAIQTANLDCDGDDEAVVVHGGWNSISVYADTLNRMKEFTPTHPKQDALALGDVNNDGRIDICYANGNYGLSVLYNQTHCWKTAVRELNTDLEQLSIAPNPVLDYVKITARANGTLKVYNAVGKVIYSAGFSGNMNINTANWAADLYYVTLHTDNGLMLKTKLVKM